MTTLPHALGRFPMTIGAALLALALALVTVATGAPAAALRSGPDVAVRADVELRHTSGDGVEPSSTTGAASSGDASRAGRIGPSATGYVAPVAGVDPPSGVERRFDPPEVEWGAGHRGVDLIAPAGTRVVSPGPGIVTFAGQVARRGVVVITHPDGLRSSLEPVTASVPVGTAVVAGTALGVVEGARTGDSDLGDGESGASPDGTSPGDGTTPNHCAPRSCVHWGVRRGERYIDPLSLLDRPPIVLLPDR